MKVDEESFEMQDFEFLHKTDFHKLQTANPETLKEIQNFAWKLQSQKDHEQETLNEASESGKSSSPNEDLNVLLGKPAPVFDPHFNYHDLYWDLFLKNETMIHQMDEMAEERDDKLKKIVQIESFYLLNVDRFHSERY